MAAVPLEHPTVLVFDDEDDLREVMCRMLERKGFTALPAGDPNDAVAVCKEHQGDIHVLLADLGMPDAIGLGVARDTRAVRPGIRVVYVSGLPKESAVSRGLLHDEDTVIQKPFTTDGLVAAVREILAA
ncbi:hypothetical protein GCM10010123_09850 [Pilimelia anulata]|uniref:Response regulatory domain-containing protein n=1 Tax=Pilimelia anulata TaxID=53371 RepID=A0A8J3B407_9ACTN|nr:response regulator [Pilimelia anulata]GGJ82134.1 hypothetical protein GCM10010123_09850 [Pilimelia anulata]